MASQVEIVRQKAAEAEGAYWTEMDKFGEDNLPNESQEQHVAELRSAMMDAQKAVANAESFLKLAAEADSQRGKHRNPAKMPTAAEAGDRQARKSIGTEFVENPSFKEWLAMVAPGGNMPSGQGSRLGVSPSLGFKGFADLDRRSALITGASDTSAGAFVVADQYTALTELGRRPLTIRQLVTQLTTESDSVEYVRVTTETNAAGVVAEATATSGSSGAKPESTLAYERITALVKTIANWMPASRRALADARQMRGMVDEFLKMNLEYAFEDEIVSGDGTGEHFTGILNTSGTQSQAWDTNAFVTARKAKRKVLTVGRRRPTAYLLNPIDWETMDLKVDNQNRFYGDGPFGVSVPRLWGLPVAESEAVPEGTGLVGDFSQCIIWDREVANLYVSDSHMDFFVRNMIAILAESRAAFGILKPSAIVEIDLTA